MEYKPLGYSEFGYMAVVNGKRMEFVSQEEYFDYIQEAEEAA